MRNFLGLIVFSLIATFSYGQEITSNKKIATKNSGSKIYNKANQGNAHYTIDHKSWGFFIDRPGKHKPYENASDYYTTICTNNASKGVSISFQQFAIEKFDHLYIWDEKRSDAVTDKTLPKSGDLVGKYTGNGAPPNISSKKGCLTFRFHSDSTVVKNGWYGKLGTSNITPPDPCKDFNKQVDSELVCGVKIHDRNSRGKNKYELYGDCTMPGWPASGKELIYKFVNQKPSDLFVRLVEYNGKQPKVLNLYVLNDCKPDACIGNIMRPAENGHQDRDYVKIENAPAGTYYIVVDGNQKSALRGFDLVVECAGGGYETCDNPYYYDDFESNHKYDDDYYDDYYKNHRKIDYHVGDYITKVNPYWYKKNDIGLRDARISDRRSSNGTQSLEFNRKEEGAQDVFFDLGNKFKGAYRICWNMYIERNRTAFFGLFGGDNSDPWGTISKEFEYDASEYQGRWFDVELYVDLNKNKYVLFMDNRRVSYAGDYVLNLDKLNFYGLTNAHFYIDHFCYGPVKSIPSAPASARNSEFTTPNTDLVSKKISKADIRVSPNPAKEEAYLDLSKYAGKAVDIQIYNTMAVEVFYKHIPSVNNSLERIPLNNIDNGMYIINVNAKGVERVSKKLIISK
jgi:hypothetical protein